MAKAHVPGVSIAPFEVVFPGTEIEVTTDQPVDARLAQGRVGISGVRGRVDLAQRGHRMRWTAVDPLEPGPHLLHVDGSSIPFLLTDSVARVPATVQVYALNRVRVNAAATARLRSDQRSSGRFVEFVKGVHKRTGAPVAMAFDQRGRPVDGAALLAHLDQTRARTFGKRDEALHERARQVGTAALSVAIWVRCDEALELERKAPRARRAVRSTQVRIRDAAVKRAVTDMVEHLSRATDGASASADRLAPVVYATLTPAELSRLERDDRVLGLFLHERDGRDDLIDSIAAANADDVHGQQVRGGGVNVAVWESGPDQQNQLVIAARYSTAPDTSAHARLTHAIIRNRQRTGPNGHAPACNLHSANDKDLDALAWAVEQGCTVISQSFHRSHEPGRATLSYDDVYKDWLALHLPYPTICQASGNYWATDPDDIDPPEDEYVNHKGFNGLVVGNHNDTATAMVGSSVFRNPASPHGDRELPEVAANGDRVTAVGMTDTGTSLATPAVAGGVALIQSANSTLQFWPEACRAIVLAAAARRNISFSGWWRTLQLGIDGDDGAGAHDARESWLIARQARSRNAAATHRGWDAALLRGEDILDGSQLSAFSYRIRTPRWAMSPRVKVALAWDSRVTVRASVPPRVDSVLTVDLDLFVLDGNGLPVGVSASQDNSYEIVEFAARRNAVYEIRIQRFAGTEDVHYGIAWTVIDDNLIGPVLPPIVSPRDQVRDSPSRRRPAPAPSRASRRRREA